MGSIEKKERKEKKEKKVKSEEKEVKIKKEVIVPTEDVEMKDEDKEEKKEKKEKKEKIKVKKEKKEKKEKKSESSPEPTTTTDASSPAKKRKRDTEGELAIDLSLPTPPSKKQLRKLKKSGEPIPTTTEEAPAAADAPATETKPAPTPGPNASQSRGDFGVWIGNLRFSTSAETLKNWLLRDPSPLTEEDITRINMPMNKSGARGNKGFAYVDFKSAKGLAYALSLSESDLDTRRVLIKDSKDFGGRPKKEVEGEKSKTEQKTNMKAPTKILFVGNLPFDTTDDDLREHFAFAGGQIVRVRTARFEDSGKCKGFSFLDFDSEETVKRCLSGVAPGEELENVEGKEGVKLEKTIKDRKMLGGKRLKLEFGEAPDVRYKKRFGNKRREFEERGEGVGGDAGGEEAFAKRRAMSAADAVMGVRPQRQERRPYEPRKVDARSIAPGAALASAPRLTGGIVESKGKKMTFDD